MKIFKLGEIDKAVAVEENRYTLRALLLDVERKRLVATDGHLLIVAPVEVEKGDVTGLVPPEAIKYARAIVAKEGRHMGESWRVVKFVALKDKIEVTDVINKETRAYVRPTGTFPKYEKVFEKPLSAVPTICFNLDLLNRAVAALGEFKGGGIKSVCIWWNGDNDKGDPKVMLVKTAPDGPLALVAPVRIDRKANWRTTIAEVDAIAADRDKVDKLAALGETEARTSKGRGA